MNESEIREVVLAQLADIAPEVDPASLSPSQPLRDQVDLDSFDWLRFLVALHERCEVEIPESDYKQLTSVDRLVEYISGKSG